MHQRVGGGSGNNTGSARRDAEAQSASWDWLQEGWRGGEGGGKRRVTEPGNDRNDAVDSRHLHLHHRHRAVSSKTFTLTQFGAAEGYAQVRSPPSSQVGGVGGSFGRR